MQSRQFVFITFLAFAICVQASVQAKSADLPIVKDSSFSIALETLQNQINYKFQNVGLLRRAMTHASYSEENNKALSVLGVSVIETFVSLASLSNDIDITAKDLNRRISDISKVEASCTVDGNRLGLQKIVRVSPKTDSTTPSVVCGAFRAIIGAVAIDKGSSDKAGSLFWYVHAGVSGRATEM